MSFKDHFSKHSAEYAIARPGYPPELFNYLSDLCSEHELAWDCATGNGQAAQSLVKYFASVIATDGSEGQIAAAKPLANIEYRVATAEQADLLAGSVDLITVAQALHWFSMGEFFENCDRVLKPGGVLAVWSYGMCFISSEVDQIINSLYAETLDEYWPEERRLVEQRYQNIEFPFTEVSDLPTFSMTVRWTLEQLSAYLLSWSATQRYITANHLDPVAAIADELASAWGQSLEKTVQWPLTLVVSRK